MKPEQFARLKKLLLEVAELPESKRDEYLAEACKDDPELLTRVKTLLTYDGDQSGIVRTDGVMRPPGHDLAAGETVSHYRILEQLGVGGMGVVYKAEDTTLKRTVALKFLPPELTRDPAAKARFLREAQAAAALDHANICTVHEIGEGEGLTFIAMAYVEGLSLKKVMEEGQLELDEAIDLSIQIAEGLKAAHAKGIVHRDIKPANILVTSGGRMEIADFGLAKFSGRSEITTGGTRMGTVSYMSPEQARGEAVDHRTDIWSLGAVLYEMSTGQRPFRGDHDSAVIYSILNEEPEPMSTVREGVPQELQWIVDKAMAKSPDERYGTAADILADLRSLRRGVEERAGGAQLIAAKRRPSIAVLPFVNMSGDPGDEYFSDGLAEDLISALSHIEDLRVAARTSAFSFKGKQVPIREIGRKLRVETVLEGSVRRSGDQLRISAQLVNAADGYHLWSERYDRQMEDVFAIQDEISMAIVDKLKVQLLQEEQAELTKRHTQNQEAYQLYLRGRYFQSRERVGEAVQCYGQAVAADPDYAPARAEASSCLNSLILLGYLPPKETFPKVFAGARKALEIDDTTGPAHAALGAAAFMYKRDWEEAERHFRRASELSPEHRGTHVWYALYLWAMGRTDEAMEQARRSREVDPHAIGPYCWVGNAYMWARQYDKAIEQLQRALQMDPYYLVTHLFLGEAYIIKEAYDKAISHYEKALGIAEDNPYAMGRLGWSYGLAGQTENARKSLERLTTLSKEKYVQSMHKALICLGIGRDEEGFAFLEKANLERDPHVNFLRHPVLDMYRTDPRFTAVFKKVGL